jgi:hypothetical protein
MHGKSYPAQYRQGSIVRTFGGSFRVTLNIAGAAAYPMNRWLIARSRGHAVVHRYH